MSSFGYVGEPSLIYVQKVLSVDCWLGKHMHRVKQEPPWLFVTLAILVIVGRLLAAFARRLRHCGGHSPVSGGEDRNLGGFCSALAVLASSSGVSTERAAFMDLVGKEIQRLNEGLKHRGATSLVFQSGNVKVTYSTLFARRCCGCRGSVS